jgi:TRAP-type C4-dicarboxylate transport system permease small subunit
MLVKAKKILDKSLEILVTVSMGVLVLDVVWQVLTRYVLKNPSSWTEELATFLMIWVGLLGASVALNRGAHLGIDYLVTKLSPRKALYVALFVFTSIAVFSLLVMVIGGSQLVLRTLITKQVSPALGLKMGYVYLAIPISGLFLVIYSIELFAQALKGNFKVESQL